MEVSFRGWLLPPLMFDVSMCIILTPFLLKQTEREPSHSLMTITSALIILESTDSLKDSKWSALT